MINIKARLFMKKLIKIWVFVGMFILTGCSQKAIDIDVSSSVYKPTKVQNLNIKDLVISNKAESGEFINTMLFSDTIIPIEPYVSTSETVEEDIKTFFNNYKFDVNSNKHLKINIIDADAYLVWGGASKIPIVGLLFVAADTDYVMNVKILFEIEEDGKVLNSYQFYDKIKIRHSAAVESSISDGYKMLIEKYRMKLFGELENTYINRYF
jgi:hypothetical protein